MGRNGRSTGRAAGCGSPLATRHRPGGGRFGAAVSKAHASEPAPLRVRVVTRWCGTYCSDGTSDCCSVLVVTSGASAPPMPAADAPLVRWRSVVLTNPGALDDVRPDVPVTVPDVPVIQPADTQF